MNIFNVESRFLTISATAAVQYVDHSFFGLIFLVVFFSIGKI